MEIKNQSKRISVDTGYGFVKAVSINDSTGDCKRTIFPSVLAMRQESELKALMTDIEEDYSVQIGNDRYYIGESAIVHSGIRRWDDKTKFSEKDVSAFVLTAAALLADEQQTQIDLCLGLPITFWKASKDSLKAFFEQDGYHCVIVGKEEKQIKINSCEVFAQGISCYFSYILDPKGQLKDISLFEEISGSFGIIDIGYRSCDFLLMSESRNGNTMREELSGSFEQEGMNVSMSFIQKALSDLVGKEISTNKIEKLIFWDRELRHQGRPIDHKAIERQSYQHLAERIANKIKQKWDSELNNLDFIIITGGGGATLFPYLAPFFDTELKLQPDSQFANAEGFLAIQANKLKHKNE